MNMRRSEGILLSAVSPKFLHANSTSHTWPFSAVAELIDNAYDPDVMAKQFWIDWTQIKEFDCLTFQDNGRGMTKSRMYEMLSLGFSDKQAVRGHIPVGQYGNGFKSSSMRLGKDAIIFSKTRDTMSVGLLSQSYLESIQAEHVVVPIVTFGHDGQCPDEDAASLQDILKHSLFNTAEELFTELRAITSVSSTGTRIIIWNLRRVANGETEFDLSTDRYDIRIPLDACETHKNQNVAQSVPEIIYSLRAYCSILYLKPRMQIIIRGQKVKTQLISKSLALTRKDQYKPVFLKERIPITFGYNIRSKDEYGMMMYHKNRLIKAFERVGCQRKGGFRGVGVIGVIECDFLQPTHNKQDFDDTEEYRKIMNNLAKKLEEYWDEIQLKRKGCSVPAEDAVKHPDQTWVQCDECQKWRRLPDGIDSGRLPDKWFCRFNPDPQYRSCQTEEEPEDPKDEQKCDPKPYKRLSSVKVSAVTYRNDLINFLAHLHRHVKVCWIQWYRAPADQVHVKFYQVMQYHWICQYKSKKIMAKMQKKDQQQMPAPVLPLPTAPALPLPIIPLSGSEWWRPAEGAPTGLSSESFTHPSCSGQNLPNDTMLMDCEDHVPRTPGREKNSKMRQKKIRQQVPAPALPLPATPLSDSEWWRPAEGAPTGLSSESFTHPSCSGHNLSHDTMLMDCEDHVSITPERVKQVVPQTVGVSPINTKTMELTTPSVPPGCIQKTIKKQEKIQWESLVEEAFKNKGVGKVLEGNRPRSPMLKVQQQPDGLQDTYKEQVNQLQQELEEMKNRCGHLQETEKEVQRRLKDMEIENCSLSCQCEQLNIFHEESCRKLRNLRQRIGRLLVTFLPTLDLEEINLDSDVMDKILDKVLNEVTLF